MGDTGEKKFSRYDKIHDRYLPPAGRKAGTRYERLMAVVQAGLQASSTVVHDVHLRGQQSGEQHQIDVLMENQAGKRRVLIECKDFDVAGGAVGIGIVRDFYGVVADVKPDEAWIVSCNGFTKPARAFAKAFGIRLAILREFRESDWEGRLRTIVLTFDVRAPIDLNVRLETTRMDLVPSYQEALRTGTGPGPTILKPDCIGVDPQKAPITVTFDGHQLSFQDFFQTRVAPALPVFNVPLGERTERLVYADLQFNLPGDVIMPVNAIQAMYRVSGVSQEIRVEAPSAAVLLLVRGENDDVVVFDEQIRAYTIDKNGTVVATRTIGA